MSLIQQMIIIFFNGLADHIAIEVERYMVVIMNGQAKMKDEPADGHRRGKLPPTRLRQMLVPTVETVKHCENPKIVRKTGKKTKVQGRK
jgi:hypothetical protein